MNKIQFPEIIDYLYESLKTTEDGGLSAIFRATDKMDIPHGFDHLETFEVAASDLDELPDNFNGVEQAKRAIEQTASPA